MRPALFFLCALLPCLACSEPPPSAAVRSSLERIRIAEETAWMADEADIDYRGDLRRALEGKAGAVAKFIRHIDALDTSGAYFHAFTVFDLALEMGDARFARSLGQLSRAEASDLLSGLREAQGFDKRDAPREKKPFHKRFPRTLHALSC